MSSSPSALPTPRQLLTSVLNQISQIPAPTAPGPGSAAVQNSSTITRTGSFPERAREPPANPLRLLDARHRPLFTTLHVLFPSLLLPALDLLDRGLVTRLLDPGEEEEAGTALPAGGRPPAHRDGGPHEAEQGASDREQARDSAAAPSSSSVYLVRSAQKPTRRPYGGAGGAGDAPATTPATTTTTTASGASQRTYVVHTAAWNCTCAAFAFSAFPPLAGAPSLLAPAPRGPQDPAPAAAMMDGAGADTEEEDTDGEGGTGPWQFGGFSFDGCTGAGAGGVPPCCKHLLACVLAERWECGLGRYVARREVGREEKAGVFADV